MNLQTPHAPASYTGVPQPSELERLRTFADAVRRRDHEIRALLSRLDIRESAEAWDLGAGVIALLDGPVPPGPPTRFCPACQVADVEDYDLPIPHTDDTTACARCRRCWHAWTLHPAADGACDACGGSGHLGSQDLNDPPCPCREDNAPQEEPAPDSLWIGTYHGSHDGEPATVTTTRDDEQPQPYGWECTCGASQRFPDPYGLDRAAWRHTHPTLWDRLRQRTARLRQSTLT
ncbi:hypothetical protein [Streptomyces tubercidicus]|uniref:hypothetical protein n=1 Tax=Streptomyces tubercidicus TaxID=47759 RepID=UPI00369664C4